MSRCSGQSDVKSPVLSSQASLVLIYQPTEELSQPCPARNLNIGPRNEEAQCINHSATGHVINIYLEISPRLIEDETFNDSDSINNLMDYAVPTYRTKTGSTVPN
ncbi:hypothetical protein TNCV_3181741 [Trichonephila clavipes]|nr:hypothetical protein TNCV_3181741 [Trichonephila clavipes]